ncbi:MAG TPA: DinB family protein, partial [Pirellulaceae bacterium]|nr:DinB family protein [Pirellulaceae bacterium]
MSTSPDLSRKPDRCEYFEFYHGYVEKVPPGKLWELLESQSSELKSFFSKVTEDQAMVLHSPYTWTAKQVLGHMIDAERIFGDRIHRFAAGDPQEQPGMDQDPYVTNQDFQRTPLKDLVAEWSHCRAANHLLIARTKEEAWNNRGIASGH